MAGREKLGNHPNDLQVRFSLNVLELDKFSVMLCTVHPCFVSSLPGVTFEAG